MRVNINTNTSNKPYPTITLNEMFLCLQQYLRGDFNGKKRRDSVVRIWRILYASCIYKYKRQRISTFCTKYGGDVL